MWKNIMWMNEIFLEKKLLHITTLSSQELEFTLQFAKCRAIIQTLVTFVTRYVYILLSLLFYASYDCYFQRFLFNIYPFCFFSFLACFT